MNTITKIALALVLTSLLFSGCYSRTTCRTAPADAGGDQICDTEYSIIDPASKERDNRTLEQRKDDFLIAVASFLKTIGYVIFGLFVIASLPDIFSLIASYKKKDKERSERSRHGLFMLLWSLIKVLIIFLGIYYSAEYFLRKP